MLRLLEAKLELRRLAEDWRLWAGRIAEAAGKISSRCEVYVFGSFVEGRPTGASDVDALLVYDQLPRDCKAREELRANIEEAAGLSLCHPFQIHLADRSEASWYFRHIRQMIRID